MFVWWAGSLSTLTVRVHCDILRTRYAYSNLGRWRIWVAGKVWLRVWGVARRVAAMLWRAMSSDDVWREVHASRGDRPEPTLRRFSYLRARGIRCHLRSLASPSGRGVSIGMVSLRVHRDDVNRAYRLMTEIRD
jgi:hypothetical protein